MTKTETILASIASVIAVLPIIITVTMFAPAYLIMTLALIAGAAYLASMVIRRVS